MNLPQKKAKLYPKSKPIASFSIHMLNGSQKYGSASALYSMHQVISLLMLVK